jgi:DNA invertase Pin-like site-specific DNA recombinase
VAPTYPFNLTENDPFFSSLRLAPSELGGFKISIKEFFEMMRRVAVYARVSTADQKTGLESQIRALKEHCERMKVENYEVFADENISGAKVSRPSLDRMMVAIRNKEISTVIVYSFSRFARSTTHLLGALEEMSKCETEFISITEKIETSSPMGRCFFTVIAAISQLERELIVERSRMGLKMRGPRAFTLAGRRPDQAI